MLSTLSIYARGNVLKVFNSRQGRHDSIYLCLSSYNAAGYDDSKVDTRAYIESFDFVQPLIGV